MTDMELLDKINKELTELSIGFSKADVAIGRLTLLVDALKKVKRCTSDNKLATVQSISLGIDDKLSKIEEDLEALASIGLQTAPESKDKEGTRPSVSEEQNEDKDKEDTRPSDTSEYPVKDIVKFLFENSKYEIPSSRVQATLCDDSIGFMVEHPFALPGIGVNELFFIGISDNLSEMLEDFDDTISNLHLVEFDLKNKSAKSQVLDWFRL